MSKFNWGKVIDRFDYDFDGEIMEVVKFHPWKAEGNHLLCGQPDLSEIHYHCAELRESNKSLQYLLIAWIANKNLGLNQHSLVYGISKALSIN